MSDLLTPQQSDAIDLLIEGELTQVEIAKKLDISRTTLFNWRSGNPVFRREYNDRLARRTQIVLDKFEEKLDKVSDELYQIIMDKNVAPRDRINAIQYWINRSVGTPTSSHEVKTVQDIALDGVKEDEILDYFE